MMRGLNKNSRSKFWAEVRESLSKRPSSSWPEYLESLKESFFIDMREVRLLSKNFSHATPLVRALEEREVAARKVQILLGDENYSEIFESTPTATAFLDQLRFESPRRALGPVGILGALCELSEEDSTLEHEKIEDPVESAPLMDHLALRVLSRKLRGLEIKDIKTFQVDSSLPERAFEVEVSRLSTLDSQGMLPLLRFVLTHLDIAKGGTSETRATWTQGLGVDLQIHNQASATIVENHYSTELLSKLFPHATWIGTIFQLIASHGMAGQIIRGETPGEFLYEWIGWLSDNQTALSEELGVTEDQAIKLALDVFHLMNICDTAGVREGLLDEELWKAFVDIRDFCEHQLSIGRLYEKSELEKLSVDWWPDVTAHGFTERQHRLLQRLLRLRKSKVTSGEGFKPTAELIGSLSERELEEISSLFDKTQFWYAEAGTGNLLPSAQLKLFAIGLRALEESFPPARGYHLNFLPLVKSIAHDSPALHYRLRLLEALLRDISFEKILFSTEVPSRLLPATLGWFDFEMGGLPALSMSFVEGEETKALLTLLPIYEKKSGAAYHSTLKNLCDLYDLRKDDFDRVANESNYLKHMNSASSDKERMLAMVRPGRMIDVGPGGGALLDLMEQNFPGSQIVGIDASEEVYQALARKKATENHDWEVVKADAFKIPELFEEGSVDTIIFCSILHEIFSYVSWSTSEGTEQRFTSGSVRALLQNSYKSLAPGGRILIRDGVKPPPEFWILELRTPSAKDFFSLFVKEFKGREIQFEELEEGKMRLSSSDAMEFLYTFVWGAESFPYEVREQYGVFTYKEYEENLLEWLGDLDSEPRLVSVLPELRSYLQPGYVKALTPHVTLRNLKGEEISFPDSNAVWVVEKGGI